MMYRIKLSVIAERFPEIGVYLVDDKYNEPRMWVAQASVGKPLYEGKIPLSTGRNNFVDAAVDGNEWVYVPQYDYRKYISPKYCQRFGRPKKEESENVRKLLLKIDNDLEAWLYSKRNKSVYINGLIRKDMEKTMNIKEQEGNDMGNMNAYNFVDRGCLFYHVIAESEEQCLSLAEGAGYDVSGMELELERMNVRDELGRPYTPRIEEAMTH